MFYRFLQEKEAAAAAQPKTTTSDGLHYEVVGTIPSGVPSSSMLPPLPGHPPTTYLPPLPPPPSLPPLPPGGPSLMQMLPPPPSLRPNKMIYPPPFHGQMRAPPSTYLAARSVPGGKFFQVPLHQIFFLTIFTNFRPFPPKTRVYGASF